MFTKSARDSALIFCMIRRRCALTVISLNLNSPATCLSSIPLTTGFINCCSRWESDAKLSRSVCTSLSRAMFRDFARSPGGPQNGDIVVDNEYY